MNSIPYRLIKDYGVIAEHNGIQLKLTYIAWGVNPPCYDVRAWKDGVPLKGMIFEKDALRTLKGLIDTFVKNDANCQVIEKHKGRPRKTPAISTSSIKEKTKDAIVDTEIIKFPTAKIEIEKQITEGSATYEDCEKKLTEDRNMFKDYDNQFVIDGLLELAKVDQNFRNNLMRADKSYKECFKYFAEMARNGYCVKFGNVAYMDNNMALGCAIDYYNKKVEEK